MSDTVKNRFSDTLAAKGMMVGEEQLAQFELYLRELTEWNEKINLTAITEREQVYWKHFFDSASLGFFVPLAQVKRLADIGAGAGFPSIPLKILFPHLHVTIVDSLNKRIQFLQHLARVLGLDRFEAVHGRAEDVARQPGFRDGFDLVTARAVARLPALNELCLPFVRPSGLFVAMKGADPSEEVAEAAKSLSELSGKVERIVSFELPLDQSRRHLVLIRKTGATPKKYPRKAGLPLKQPIL